MATEKIVKVKKEKRNKSRTYSYINAIDELLDKYFTVYDKLTEHREGCISPEIYDKMNALLVEDYNASINNLERLSKQGAKILKKKYKYENKRIFWYRIRRFFRFKKNEEIEALIAARRNYSLEFGYLFEDIISSKIRHKIEDMEKPVLDLPEDEEPDYVSTADKLFKGPEEHRALFGEVVNDSSLAYNSVQQIEYANESNSSLIEEQKQDL